LILNVFSHYRVHKRDRGLGIGDWEITGTDRDKGKIGIGAKE